MTEAFDPYEPCLALWRQLSRADQCRLIDQAISEFGCMMPIPELENVREHAEWWAGITPDRARVIYLAEIYALTTTAQKQSLLNKATEDLKQEKESGPDA